MITKLARVTVLVRDQDEALAFYTQKLGLEVRAEQTMGPGMRWLTVAPPGQKDVEIVLLKPDPKMQGEAQAKTLLGRVGQAAPWVFYTEDCQRDYQELSARGVKFTSPPQGRPYGLEAVFQDLYGNPFSLLQPR